MRYDRFTTSPANTALVSASNSHLSPKLAIDRLITPGFSLFGSYGQSYRAPGVWETYADNMPGGVLNTSTFNSFKSNPDLKPETVTTLELGTHYERSVSADGDGKFRVRATVFQAKARDMITQKSIGTFTRTAPFIGTGSIFQYQNVSTAGRDGLELEGVYERDTWRFTANYSRLRVKDDATGDNLFSPPDKLATQLSYALPPHNLRLSWSGLAVAAQDYDTTVNRRRSGYAVHDVYATWIPDGGSYTVDFGISNLADKRYVVYQSSNAAALTAYEVGRSYKVALTGSF